MKEKIKNELLPMIFFKIIFPTPVHPSSYSYNKLMRRTKIKKSIGLKISKFASNIQISYNANSIVVT